MNAIYLTDLACSIFLTAPREVPFPNFAAG